MLLSRDSVMLNALGIKKEEAQFSEDMDNTLETSQRMDAFMKKMPKRVVAAMTNKVMG